jgi:hypothetical protein
VEIDTGIPFCWLTNRAVRSARRPKAAANRSKASARSAGSSRDHVRKARPAAATAESTSFGALPGTLPIFSSVLAECTEMASEVVGDCQVPSM